MRNGQDDRILHSCQRLPPDRWFDLIPHDPSTSISDVIGWAVVALPTTTVPGGGKVDVRTFGFSGWADRNDYVPGLVEASFTDSELNSYSDTEPRVHPRKEGIPSGGVAGIRVINSTTVTIDVAVHLYLASTYNRKRDNGEK